MNVLIAEDDFAAAETLSEFLVGHGFTCFVENSGKATIDIFDDRFDAVIIDVNMPGGLSGLDILPKIKKSNPNVLAMVMSAYDIAETRVKSLENGADFFFPKPLDLKLILEQLRNNIVKN